MKLRSALTAGAAAVASLAMATSAAAAAPQAGNLGNPKPIKGSTIVKGSALDADAFAPTQKLMRARAAKSRVSWNQSARLDKVGGTKARLKAYTAIQSKADRDGCGQFKTSATLKKRAKGTREKWIKNVTTWQPQGIGAGVSVAGVSLTSQGSSGDKGISWKNTKGQGGAWLDGSVCLTGFLALYLGQTTAASTLYRGNPAYSTTKV